MDGSVPDSGADAAEPDAGDAGERDAGERDAGERDAGDATAAPVPPCTDPEPPLVLIDYGDIGRFSPFVAIVIEVGADRLVLTSDRFGEFRIGFPVPEAPPGFEPSLPLVGQALTVRELHGCLSGDPREAYARIEDEAGQLVWEGGSTDCTSDGDLFGRHQEASSDEVCLITEPGWLQGAQMTPSAVRFQDQLYLEGDAQVVEIDGKPHLVQVTAARLIDDEAICKADCEDGFWSAYVVPLEPEPSASGEDAGSGDDG